MTARVVRFKEWYAGQPVGVKLAVVVGGGAAGIIAGVVAAPAIGAAASAAGLGVAAGTLSGAAASSAGLAALGGGALAAGGMGVAGGMVVAASAAMAAGTVAAAYASKQTAKDGARTLELARAAETQDVPPGGIRFAESRDMKNVASHAEEFGGRARSGERPVAHVRSEYAKAFLGQLLREGFVFVAACLKEISDPELRRIVETILFASAAGAAMGTMIGGIVGGPNGAQVGALVGAGIGALAGYTALAITIRQVQGPEGPELMVGVK